MCVMALSAYYLILFVIVIVFVIVHKRYLAEALTGGTAYLAEALTGGMSMDTD